MVESCLIQKSAALIVYCSEFDGTLHSCVLQVAIGSQVPGNGNICSRCMGVDPNLLVIRVIVVYCEENDYHSA